MWGVQVGTAEEAKLECGSADSFQELLLSGSQASFQVSPVSGARAGLSGSEGHQVS